MVEINKIIPVTFHRVNSVVHLLPVILATCPAQRHLIFSSDIIFVCIIYARDVHEYRLPVNDALPDGGAHPVAHHDAHAVLRVRGARRLRQQVAAHLADVLRHLPHSRSSHTSQIHVRSKRHAVPDISPLYYLPLAIYD